MSKESRHLDNIIERENRIANLQVAFVDIEKYSQRRTQNQAAVVEALTRALRTALDEVSRAYVTYAQQADVNLDTDIIRLPTGDGAAVVFPFGGMVDIHLRFARELLRAVEEHNAATPCERFDADGWCNCHDNFRLRVGLAEGRGVVFRDLNGNYNAAGTVLNDAARVMGLVDGQQVAVTGDAHRQLVDLVQDPTLGDRFRLYEDVPIKHGKLIRFYQYLGEEGDAISGEEPRALVRDRQARQALQQLTTMVPLFGAAGIDVNALRGPNTEEALMRVVGVLNAAMQQEGLGPLGKVDPPDHSGG
jgi:class 3 adenylate cyclase